MYIVIKVKPPLPCFVAGKFPAMFARFDASSFQQKQLPPHSTNKIRVKICRSVNDAKFGEYETLR